MGLFSKNKNPAVSGCATVEDFFRLHSSTNLSGIVYHLFKIKMGLGRSNLSVEINGKYGFASDYHTVILTRDSWDVVERDLQYALPKKLKKSSRPDAITALKILTERVAEYDQESDPFNALLLGFIYEYGWGLGDETDINAAERCYYIAKQGGIKYMPLIKYLKEHNCTNYKSFKNNDECLFASLLPPVLKTIIDPNIKPEIDKLSKKETEQLQKIATLGLCYCCGNGFPFSRLMIMRALGNVDEMIGEDKYFDSSLYYDSIIFEDQIKKEISEAKLWVYNEALSGDPYATAACRWFNVSFN